MIQVVLLSFINLFVLVFNVLLLLRVVLSWVAPGSTGAFNRLVHELTEPILAPIRRIVPGGGGTIDFSPLIAFFLLQGLQILANNLLV